MEKQSDDYQEHGSDYLVNNNCALLADDMGVGKTKQVIMACDKINAQKILVICPAVARINWVREWETWSIFSNDFEILETKKDWPSGNKNVIVSYTFAEKYAATRLAKYNWDVLVLDEAHFIKSVNAKRTKAIWGVDGIVRRCKRIWALTGTPMPKSPDDLWPMFYTFGWTPYNYNDFVRRYCTYYIDERGQLKITGANRKHIGELKMIFKERVMRRLKSKVLEALPAIRFESVLVKAKPIDFIDFPGFLEYYVPMNREKELKKLIVDQHKALESAFEQPRTISDKLKVLKHISTSMPVLRRYTGCLKVKPIVDLVKEELLNESYEKIVIFCVHRDVIEAVREGLKEFHAVTLYGGTAKGRAQRNIDRFMKYPKYRVFVGNIKACGTAINLTSASEVLFIEQEWNPGDNTQAMMRIYRRGQDKNVRVRVASIADTVDERLNTVLFRKMRDISEVYEQENYNMAKNSLTLPEVASDNDLYNEFYNKESAE